VNGARPMLYLTCPKWQSQTRKPGWNREAHNWRDGALADY
jgi:hypothetical protein